MSAYDAALELTDMTGWSDHSIAVLLAAFIQEKGLTAEAVDWLHAQANAEGAPDADACDSCGVPFTWKDIDGGRCLSCGTMICAKEAVDD